MSLTRCLERAWFAFNRRHNWRPNKLIRFTLQHLNPKRRA